MNKKLKKLAAMMMALMMIALVGIPASAQTEEAEEQMFFGVGWDILNRIAGRGLMEEDVAQAVDTANEEQLILRMVQVGTLEEDEDQDEEQGLRDFFSDVKTGFIKMGQGIKKVAKTIYDASEQLNRLGTRPGLKPPRRPRVPR